jgi:hypothetical protein
VASAFPNLITHVATTDATVTDNQMTGPIHDQLAGKALAPGRHYLDSGYLSAALVVAEAARHGIAPIGPLRSSESVRTGFGYRDDHRATRLLSGWAAASDVMVPDTPAPA